METEQQTIKSPFLLSGIGIHSGKESRINVLPAKASTGIVFKVIDVNPPLIIPAAPPYAVKKARETRLQKEGTEIQTVEHLLAAAYGLEIDNLIIEISGREIPILDGSALPFVAAFKKAEISPLSHPKKFFRIHAPITVEEDNRGPLLMVAPLDRLRISFVVDFPVIGCQFFSFDADKCSFETEIAPARTFGYKEELEALKQKGLGQGASLENALGIGKDGYLNPPRFPNEPVRHKILDLLGDLSLLGAHIEGHIIAIKSGHRLNLELVERLGVIYG